MGAVGDILFGSTSDAGVTGYADLMTPGQQDLLNQLTSLLSGQIGQGLPAGDTPDQ